MSSSFFSTPAPATQWQVYRQQQQHPNQGPAGSLAPLAAELDPLDEGDDEASGLDGGTGDDSFDSVPPQDSSSGSSDNDEPPAATTSSAEPLRAERRRSNQLEKELRKARAQLSRFSEINPDETASCSSSAVGSIRQLCRRAVTSTGVL